MRKIIRFSALILTLFLLLSSAAAEEMRVDFFNVGKGDAALITLPEGEHVLIDAGTNKMGKLLVSDLKKRGIEKIDIMIITHYDKDHVGGADKFLEKMDVALVLMPDYEKDGNQYEDFVEALGESRAEGIRMQARESRSYDWGDVHMYVTAAHETDYGPKEENDFSLAVRLSYGATRFFFTGDAETARQNELLEEGDVQCDVLKVPYHGRYLQNSEVFLHACSPKIAFITDSEEYPANIRILSILESLGTAVYSARDGSIAVLSDGTNVWVSE